MAIIIIQAIVGITIILITSYAKHRSKNKNVSGDLVLIVLGIVTISLSAIQAYQNKISNESIQISDIGITIRANNYPSHIDSILLVNCPRSFVMHDVFIGKYRLDIDFERDENVIKQIGERMPIPIEIAYVSKNIRRSKYDDNRNINVIIDDLVGQHTLFMLPQNQFQNINKHSWDFKIGVSIKGKYYYSDSLYTSDHFSEKYLVVNY